MFDLQGCKPGEKIPAEAGLAAEALCFCVAQGPRAALGACLERYAAATVSGTVPLHRSREQAEALLQRFCCTALLVGEDSARVQGLADFWLDSLRRCSNARDLMLMFGNCAEMFACLMERHRGPAVGCAPDDCRRYIDDHLTEEITMEAVAVHYGYNAAYFSRKFKQMFGVNFRAYLLRQRLKCAARELAESRQNVLDISEKYCFCSQSHFQNAFRAQYGMTPRQYRVQMQARQIA